MTFPGSLFHCEICGAAISMFTSDHMDWHIKNGEEEEVKEVLLKRAERAEREK